MPATKAEIAYLEHRLGATLLQCESASGACSKASHEGLVELYRFRLAALRKDGPATRLADALIEQAREAGVIGPDPRVSPGRWSMAGSDQTILAAQIAVAYA